MKLKNYILLSVFYIFTILLVIYWCVIYKNSSKNISDSNISDYVVDVTGKGYDELYNNISNYNTENNQFIIYVTSHEGNRVASFEDAFKSVISDKNLKGKILYIDIDDLKDFEYINRLLEDFGYSERISVSSLPIFIVVNNSRVADLKSVSVFSKDDIESIVNKVYD